MDVVYTLAVFAIRAGDVQLPVGTLLVGRVDAEMVFATSMFLVPLAQSGLSKSAAEQLLVELSALLYINVDRVLAAGLTGLPLSSPAQYMHAAVTGSLLVVTTIRPESGITLELTDVLGTAREIARQHLIHEQSIAGVNLADVVPLHFECGPF